MLLIKPIYSTFNSEIINCIQYKKCCRYDEDGKPLTLNQLRAFIKRCDQKMKNNQFEIAQIFLQRITYLEYNLQRIDALSTKNCQWEHIIG